MRNDWSCSSSWGRIVPHNIQRAIEGRRTVSRPRNSEIHISHKNDLRVNTYVELKRLAEDREEWKRLSYML